MDKTKSKLAAFFDNDDEEPSFPQKPVVGQKLSQYAQGSVRKSRREKEKEAAEAKKKEEEEDAARAYAEFIETFEGEDGGKDAGLSFVKASSETAAPYVPAFRTPTEHGSGSGRASNRERMKPPSPPPSAPKPKGKRAMDAFLEEIKREQAQREVRYSRHAHGRSVTAMAAYDGQSGSKDRGDSETSNVFVANLPPHVTEQSLGTFFARVGPVGSVKIMWPRTDGTTGPGADMSVSRKIKGSTLSGFVSFMRRKDAEAALREFDGFDWGGSILRVGWSKAVPMAAKPLYTASGSRSEQGHHRRSRSRSRSRSRHRSRTRSHSRDRRRSRSPRRSYHRRSRSRSRSRDWSRSRSPSPHSYNRRSHMRSHHSASPRRRRSRSRSPQTRRENEEADVTDTFIRAVAAEVKGHGPKYEQNLREREQSNPKYAFIMRKNHRRHAFYRGLVESQNSLEPEFDDEGYNSIYSTDSAEDSERERSKKTALGRLARKRFEAMLRAMTGRRGELARCMAFCLEHAEAATEVADIIVASLLVDGTAVPRKVARLHLICDILHNSAASVPSAWKFRQEFQSRLGIVFDHLANIYHSFPGRITADVFKKQITAVVDIWEDWIVFPPDFTTELRMRLNGETNTQMEAPMEEKANETQEFVPKVVSRFKPSSFQPAPAVSELEAAGRPTGGDDDGEPMDEDIDGEPVSDVDGEPINDDVDGVPIDDDMDGLPLNDVDGVPMGDDDDIDGAPLDGHLLDT